MRILNAIALALVVIGGINWGLVGLFDLDLVQMIFGRVNEALAQIVYIVVGIAAVYCIYLFKPLLASP
jgi:hypothetical protein